MPRGGGLEGGLVNTGESATFDQEAEAFITEYKSVPAMWQGYQSTRHTVDASQGHFVTRSTHHHS